MSLEQQRNLTMLADFYEFTMANGYLENGIADEIVVFDMFFRRIPDGGGFAVFVGLDQLISYMKDLHFTEEDIEYFRSKKQFSEKFLDYLRNFHFECDVWSIREGTPVFPYEPIVTVRGPLIQTQMVETMLLLTINYQTLVATKANRIVRAAEGRGVVEFGSRRAQSYDAAILGARAAYIAGCAGTACSIVDRDFGIPASGTMAHSWVQVFDNEYEAFKAYAKTYPDNCTLLVDTYNVVTSGIPNAIRVFNEVVVPAGFRPKAVRIDSGDLAYLSKKARKMLDDAGYPDVKIMASNSLDEYIVRDLLLQGAKLDLFGVGENLITSKSEPVFGGVYKLAAVQDAQGNYHPKIKISESVEKITTPGFKEVYRLYSRENGKALADYITLRGEEVDDTQDLTIFDPNAVWKRKQVYDFRAEKLLHQIFDHGKLCYQSPTVEEIRSFCAAQLDTLWDESKRFEYPHRYYVDLSQKLWDVKQQLLEEMGSH
ncbi:nicotinate phosphoribosyltransferase [Angelakisella massiliensis]|uniref:nicotinate phosphoribosyltransferase n=1 Tax=Angelakisella massiliensis TaxID=1871018 RepID=UPI0008F7FD49|nr:nicotinate phosphoribosyltransferase [Angelakisella massiliensis]